MKRLWVAGLCLTLLAACGGGGGSNNGGNNGGNNNGGASLDGYAFGGHRQQATGQTPLVNASASVYRLNGGAALVTGRTDALGRFSFSPANNSGVPVNSTLLIRVTDGVRTVSGVVNTLTGAVTKNLNEATHIAALALSTGTTSLTDAQIVTMEAAARQQWDTYLQSNPTADVSTNQALAQQLATLAANAVAAGTVTSAPAPSVANVVVTPTQVGHLGGTVQVSLTATSTRTLNVYALVYTAASDAPQVVTLTAAGSTWQGSFSVPANTTGGAQTYQVALIADDGVNPPVPSAVRTVTVLPDGQITLDLLAETLVDEPASRGQQGLDALLNEMRVHVYHGGARAHRQVNSNQSIRGAQVVVDDQPSVNGQTGNDGLLLLNVPLSLADDGVISITGSIGGRAPYRQFLVLPQGTNLQAGDRIEVNLVLATQAQWQQTATQVGVGTLDWTRMPLVALFNALNDISFQGVTPQAVAFRAIPQTDRTDDGDWFGTNLPSGAVAVTGHFADTTNATLSPAFGPVTLNLAAGTVSAVSALLAPAA